MAHYSGSGKWVKLQAGILSMGKDSTTYGSVYAYERNYGGGGVFRGIKIDGFNYFSLTGLSELAIGDVKGYTGTITMYTKLQCPYDLIIWDPDNNLGNIVVAYKTVRFVNGVCVGIT